jgi:starch phosphorylase
VPAPLSFLETLSRNLWWSWHQDALELFRRINPKLWEESERNPLIFLIRLPQSRLEELARDRSFLAHQQRVKERFENRVLFPVDHSDSAYGEKGVIAYFSMEFGIHESLPLFAGGLGVLAGDHLKAASDMAIPMVAIGILYRQGYFRQFLNQDGWQQEYYPETELFHLPLEAVRDVSGNPLRIKVPGPDGEFEAVVWKIMIGRIPLYLLDANLPENPYPVREITARLYAGDQKIRLAQESLLGIGGMRALEAIGIVPTVCHMNEGHCAFTSLERLAQTIERYDVDLKTALEIVPRATVFTTHTPVSAGHDEFPAYMVRPILRSLADRLRTNEQEILSWGQPVGSGPDGPLSMFVLGLRLTQYCNGVSELHGRTARRMWSHVWPQRPEEEVPISHVTNGIHISTFISSENSLLFERYLGPEWHLHTWNVNLIERIGDIYDEELWRAHEMNRSRLIGACRELMLKQYARRNAPRAVMEEAATVLDPDILTIAFARRFATYKRATLLMQDPDRLEAIINSKSQPVQFIFAGKAHPRDDEGKELIRRVTQFARRESVRHRFIFLEDYDMRIARHLLQGADVWLNTPRRPYEACGTSGMKAAINGVLNVSILDGWWCEGYDESLGWRIGDGDELADAGYQDAVEGQALYNVLENEVIPRFYERKNGDAPQRWLRMMKASMKMAILDFCSSRMVHEYESRFYLPIFRRFGSLVAEEAKEAKNFAVQRERLEALWKEIRIEQPERETAGTFRVGEEFEVTTVVHLGGLKPEEVEVELYFGPMRSIEALASSGTQPMTLDQDLGGGRYRYRSKIICEHSGRYGFTARVVPSGDDRVKFTPNFLTWA